MFKNLIIFLVTSIMLLLGAEVVSRFAGFGKLEIMSGRVVDFHNFFCGEGCERFPGLDWVNDPTYFDKNSVIEIGDQKVTKEKKDNEKRVLFIGDSATYGLGVEKEQRFSSVLKAKFDDSWKMINSGIPGFDNVDELFQLKTNLYKLSPDFIVWQIFMANDLNINISMVVRESRKKGFLLKAFPSSAFLKLVFSALTPFGFEGLLLESVREGENKYQTSKSPIDQRGLNFFNFHEGEFALYHKEPSSLEPLVREVFYKVASEFNEFCKALKVPVFVVVVPTRSMIENNLSILPDLENAKKHFGKTEEYYRENLDFSRPHRFVVETLKKLAIPFYDPVEDGVGSWFLKEGDDHPSVRGHQKISDAVEVFLRSAP